MKRVVQLSIGVLFSLLAFALAFRDVNLADLGAAFTRANYLYLIPATFLTFLGLLARSRSWQIILGGNIPFWRVFDAINQGYLLNNVLPFRLGEVGRAYLISRNQKISAIQVLASVMVERVVDLVMVIVMLMAVFPLVIGVPWARSAALGAVALGLMAIIGMSVVANTRTQVLQLLHHVVTRLGWHIETWEARAQAFLDGLAALQNLGRALQAAFWSGIAWVLAALGTWLLLLAFVPTTSLEAGVWALGILGLGAAVPSAPGSMGVYEAALVLALQVVGVEHSLALSFALVHHAMNFTLTTILGNIALSREGETLAHLAKAAQHFFENRRKTIESLSD